MTRTTDRDEGTPGSLWIGTTETTDYEPLDGGLETDVAIVGAGITGLTTAIELQERGREVAVIEADRIVEGTTGHTTAKVTSQHGLKYADLIENFDRETASQYADANEAAIDAVEERIGALGVDCGFERRPAYTYATTREDVESIPDEVEAAQSLGLPASLESSIDLPVDVEAAVRFDDQASFHPRKYLLAVAEEIHEMGGRIYEQTRVTDVDPGTPCAVETDRGEVVADDVVVATNYPVLERGGYFARLHPKRSYLLAVRVAADLPEGMYYSTSTPPETIRPHRNGEDEYLLVGGGSHTVGEGSSKERYRRCERFAREQFDVEAIDYRWSTHDHWSVDGVPFVGTIGPWADHVYVGTGFGGWGMTGGTAAGLMLSDLIVGDPNPWADAFDPLRITPGASATGLLEHLGDTVDHFVGDRARAVLASEDLPAPGEATVISQEGRPIGIYRDEDGAVHAVSATCTHMACVLAWNDAERTWDCPCHGSRFDPDGEVVSGPALEGLPSRST